MRYIDLQEFALVHHAPQKKYHAESLALVFIFLVFIIVRENIKFSIIEIFFHRMTLISYFTAPFSGIGHRLQTAHNAIQSFVHTKKEMYSYFSKGKYTDLQIL